MQAVSSRHQQGENPSHRVPRKSSSFLSLRREKDKSSSLALDSNTSTSSGPLHSKPFSYFDAYPRTKSSPTSRSHKSKTRRSSPSSVGTCAESSASIHLQERSKGPKEAAYAFPSFDSTEDLSTPTPLNTTPYLRTRSRTGPSSKSKWDPMSAVPQLRFSGSSSTQHTETPPRTPDDYPSSRESFDHFPVFVSAPVSGVEMMDALVDGMNGGSVLGASPSISNRARFGIPGHHPLYQPPLPTPPPGVVLGGGKARRHKVTRRESSSDSGDDENDSPNPAAFNTRSRRRRARPSSSRTASNSTITPLRSYTSADENILSSSSVRNTPARDLSRPGTTHSQIENRKSVVPSISEIIRAHAPPEGQTRSRPSTIRSSSLYTPSHGHGTVHEEVESEPEPLTVEEETELLSRSSIDSVADEVQRTLRHQNTIKPPPSAPPSAFLKRHSVISDNASVYSPRSDPGAASSIYSSSAASIYQQPSSPLDVTFLSLLKPSPSQAVAQYLRSARLTTLLHLTRSPHASPDNPLTVSLSDLGNPGGFPVVVFLGLGCVRHIMGLYDEMAECLGLRLITIDRWGLGRTEPRSKSAKGIMQWASAVEEVLDLLHIKQCSVMAHSAGAPYALSFANKLPSRIRGDVCLLAPWVGGSESSGYKWLKYIPNGILKTAQAAEWKLQAWMIGKPPTIAYEGIGYNAPRPQEPKRAASSSSNGNLNVVYPSNGEGRPRPSIGSGTFSEYDDLGDFEGRFESRSTLGAGQGNGTENVIFVNKRKTSKGFLERLKGSPTLPPSHPEEKHSSGKKLKGLRSMGSLKGKTHVPLRKSESSSPQLPPPLRIEVGLGLEELNWANSFAAHATENMRERPSTTRSVSSHEPTIRSAGQRSISFTSGKPLVSMPGSPSPSTVTTSFAPSNGPNNYQAALGNALLAASHAESAKGTHNDLLQILNHENHSWGFSYASYPHRVRVWYGDKDEKIAENAVRWMERTMGANRCSVKVVKGADHGLMYRSSVVVDVLEWVLAAWRTGEQSQPFSDLR